MYHTDRVSHHVDVLMFNKASIPSETFTLITFIRHRSLNISHWLSFLPDSPRSVQGQDSKGF